MISRTNAILAGLLVLVLFMATITRVDHSKPNFEVLPDMKYTPAWSAFAENPNFDNGRTMQAPVPGTIARGMRPLHFSATKEDAIRAGEELRNPFALEPLEGSPTTAVADPSPAPENSANRPADGLDTNDVKTKTDAETTAPKTDEPESTEPVTEEPETPEPAADQPATEEPGTDEPATPKPEPEPQAGETQSGEPQSGETKSGEPQSGETKEAERRASALARRNASVARGSEVYHVFCISCHGPKGLGDGPVTQRGFPPPPSLLTGKSPQMKDGQLFHILTYGQGSMARFAGQLSHTARWDVINFVRDLQSMAPASGPSEATPTLTDEVTASAQSSNATTESVTTDDDSTKKDAP